MATIGGTRVYRNGDNIEVVTPDLLVNSIPLNNFSYVINDTTGGVTLADSAGPTYKDKGVNIQNGVGQEVGSLGQIEFYLNLLKGPQGGGGIPMILQSISVVTQAIVSIAAGGVVLFETPTTEEGIAINLLTGVITFTQSKSYSFIVGLNLDRVSGTPIIEIWLECYNGVSWVIAANTARIKEYNNSNEFYCIFEIPLKVDVISATDYRVKVRESIGDAQMLATTITNGTVVPSATIGIYG